jgi:RNA polymerase sigma-70 factor (ECF subfamily)
MVVTFLNRSLAAAAVEVDVPIEVGTTAPSEYAPPNWTTISARTPEMNKTTSADPILEAFETYYDGLLRYVEQRIGNAADAADIVQETYVHVRATEREAVIANPRAFVYRVASNLSIDYLRRRAYRDQFVAADESMDEVASSDPSLERQLAGRERLDALVAAVNELPGRCREVFILRKLHHLDLNEIEKRLQISQQMIRRHLRKALLHCAARLGELE